MDYLSPIIIYIIKSVIFCSLTSSRREKRKEEMSSIDTQIHTHKHILYVLLCGQSGAATKGTQEMLRTMVFYSLLYSPVLEGRTMQGHVGKDQHWSGG